MPPITHLNKNTWKKKDMDLNPNGNMVDSHLNLEISMVIYDPTPQNPGTIIENITSSRPTASTIESFIDQRGNATFVNSIIDRNKDTIMKNL